MRGSVVDLSPASFIDSSILGVILDARRQANEGGRGFAVAHATARSGRRPRAGDHRPARGAARPRVPGWRATAAAVEGLDVVSDRSSSCRSPPAPENVIVVRQAVAGLGEALGFRDQRVDDLKAVVTEACNNVVLHAYRGRARSARGPRRRPAQASSRSRSRRGPRLPAAGSRRRTPRSGLGPAADRLALGRLRDHRRRGRGHDDDHLLLARREAAARRAAAPSSTSATRRWRSRSAPARWRGRCSPG